MRPMLKKAADTNGFLRILRDPVSRSGVEILRIHAIAQDFAKFCVSRENAATFCGFHGFHEILAVPHFSFLRAPRWRMRPKPRGSLLGPNAVSPTPTDLQRKCIKFAI